MGLMRLKGRVRLNRSFVATLTDPSIEETSK